MREFTDLAPAERAECMEAVAAVERVLREQLAPTKVNLASLGNLTPHLHWHVIARFDWDSPLSGADLGPGAARVDNPEPAAHLGPLEAVQWGVALAGGRGPLTHYAAQPAISEDHPAWPTTPHSAADGHHGPSAVARAFEVGFSDGAAFRIPFELMRVTSAEVRCRAEPGQEVLQTGSA